MVRLDSQRAVNADSENLLTPVLVCSLRSAGKPICVGSNQCVRELAAILDATAQRETTKKQAVLFRYKAAGV